MHSFWEKLPKPFFILAPMADVTDPAFRALVAKYGKPDVTYTEFVSADGLYYLNEKMSDLGSHPAESVTASPALGITLGETAPFDQSPIFSRNPLMRDLQFTEAERPIVAQMFSSKPDMIAYGAKLAETLGFDGFDINMGCPDKAIERQGAGACLIKTPKLAVELIKAAKSATSLPVSVKTRIGFNTENLEEWLTALLQAEPAAITLHLRTRKEMSAVPAHWELMKKAVEIRNRVNPSVLICGNGDVKSVEEGRAKAEESGCDGIMIGRGIFGNPWLFTGQNPEEIPLSQKLTALSALAHSFEKLSPPKSFAILKKHIKAFVTGFDGAAELRAKLMETNSASELDLEIKKYRP